ncbi:uncharacterized protein LOC131613570 [Vicia villosa]|uniref:uncharacterized protein LOC131613570 n=1 Tax=Vicia villosa TaxID=3911 RepID=UPI00273BC8B8|nr:uncharacterized protein LOC131613570 [Vicia villosa]
MKIWSVTQLTILGKVSVANILEAQKSKLNGEVHKAETSKRGEERFCSVREQVNVNQEQIESKTSKDRRRRRRRRRDILRKKKKAWIKRKKEKNRSCSCKHKKGTENQVRSFDDSDLIGDEADIDNWRLIHGDAREIAKDVWNLGKDIGLIHKGEEGELVQELVAGGSNDFEFAFKSSDGRSGGILVVWNKNMLSIKNTEVLEHAPWLEGEWGVENISVTIVVVYAPCDRRKKFVLWNELLSKINRKRDDRICLIGDFNAIRDVSERRGGIVAGCLNEIAEFDNFISDVELIDIPIQEFDKGAKLAGWVSRCRGWGMFVLKEKFKRIKECLKEWHKNHCQNLEDRIKEEKEKLNRLEIRGESIGLTEEELIARSEISSKFHNLSNLNCSLQWQRSRSKWLKEGDVNSKYFHSYINKRRKDNEILCLDINGRKVTEVKEIKDALCDHSSRQFAGRETRVIPENLSFNHIEDSHNEELVCRFSEEEIRRAVWECDSDKSPGPDDVNFGFVKEFWEEIKQDFLRVLREFHEHGRMVKGANSSFIVLITKKSNPSKISDYRPIALIGCIYKVISKVLANRLKKVIGVIISESQSAFLSNR